MFDLHFTADWSAEDAEFVGLCLEFPSLSWLAPSREEAIAGIQQLVSTTPEFQPIAVEPQPNTVVTPEEFELLRKAFAERVQPNAALRAAFARHRP